MDSLEILFLTFFLQLVSRKVFFVSRFLLYRIDELLIRPSFFVQEMPARAVEDTNVPI